MWGESRSAASRLDGARQTFTGGLTEFKVEILMRGGGGGQGGGDDLRDAGCLRNRSARKLTRLRPRHKLVMLLDASK